MSKMRLAAAAAIAFCASGAPVTRAAEAAAPWPASARGRPLPKPAWVLVIPARRAADGSLSIWRREDDWTKAWRVPRLVGGIRMVSLFGDAEDRRAVTAEAIDGMMVDSLSVVTRKYGAPALALAVTDGETVALAGYVPGRAASWVPAPVEGDAAATRERSLAALASLFGGGAPAGTREPLPEADTESAPGTPVDVEVMAQRDVPGGYEYRLRVRADDDGTAGRMLADGGLSLRKVESRDGGTAVVVAFSPDDVEAMSDGLRGASFKVR